MLPVALWAGRIGVLLFAACGAEWLLRRQTAAARHTVWVGALVGVVLLTIGTVALPRWRVLPTRATSVAHAVTTDTRTLSNESMSERAVGRSTIGETRFTFTALLLGVWCVGSGLLFLRLAAGWWQWRQLYRTSAECPPAFRDEAMRIARTFGVSRIIALRSSATLSTACTAGTVSPTILVPASAASWPSDRRVRVLTHEIAHVVRRDALLGLVARVIRATVWWHPMIWLACRRLELLAETACDDVVLLRGARPSGYAEDLLTAATCGPRFSVALARQRTVARRIEAILDASRPRSLHASRLAHVTGGLVICLSIPLGTMSARAAKLPGDADAVLASRLLPRAASTQRAVPEPARPTPRRSPPTRQRVPSLTLLRQAASPAIRFNSRERTRLLLGALDKWTESRRARGLLFEVLDDMPNARDRAHVLRAALRLPRGSKTAADAIPFVQGLPDARQRTALVEQAARRGDLGDLSSALDCRTEERSSDSLDRRRSRADRR
jgi:beta-lactamase regulating signal transducer with metallopeptidase domain